MERQVREVRVIPPTRGKDAVNGKMEEKLLRVASYSRVSTMNEEQIASFESQQAYYQDKILRNPKWTPAGNFADGGISGGKTDKRLEFQKMIRKCKKGKIDMIITKSISRFARNTLDSIQTVRDLKEIGVGVIFEKEGINTIEQTSELFLTIVASLAQEEMVSISHNVKMGIRMGMKDGRVTYHYRHFYGYQKGEDGMPEVIPNQAEVIERIYRHFLRGDSADKIKDTLNDSDIPYLEEKPWSKTVIQRILANEKYCTLKGINSNVILQKTHVVDPISKKTKKNNGELPKYHIKNNHIAIIERDMWQKVQEEIARRSSKKKVSEKGKSAVGKYNGLYALSEKLVCSHCGSPYRRVVWTKRDKSKQAVWRCVKRLDHGTTYCPNSPSIDENSIHEALIEAIFQGKRIEPDKIAVLERALEKVIVTDVNSNFSIYETEKQMDHLKEMIMEKVKKFTKERTLEENRQELQGLSDQMNELHEKMRDYQEHQSETGETTARMEEVRAYLHGLPEENLTYDDNLIRQVVQTVKVVDEEAICVVMRDGTIIQQNMEKKVRKLRVG